MKPLHAFAALCAVSLALLGGSVWQESLSARAAEEAAVPVGAYDYAIDRFFVEMEVSRERTVKVREEITASFTGYDSHGIIRDFPLGDGVKYSDLSARCEVGGREVTDFAPYIQSDSPDILSFYLRGDGRVSGESRTYVISYTMSLRPYDPTCLPLDVIGFGWQCSISDVEVRVTVPEGLLDYNIYTSYGGRENEDDVADRREGNTLILTADSLAFHFGNSNGITLELNFDEGVLRPRTDLTIFWIALIGLGVLSAGVLFKFLACRDPILTKTVNLTAPDNIDPLLMGKYVDGKVDKEDLGASIFYLADQGYLGIDLRNGEDDLTLVRTDKPLPEDFPTHLRVIMNGLFVLGDKVSLKTLSCAFYTTAKTATSAADSAAGGLYTKRSRALTVFLGVLTVLLLGGFALLNGIFTVFAGYFNWFPAVVALLSYLIACSGSCRAWKYREKWSKGKMWGTTIGFFVLALLPALAFFVVRSASLTIWAELLLTVLAAGCGTLGGRLISRTRSYSDILGQILGFRQFLQFTEKDKVEFMLRDDPTLYYRILPYAQVLGVTDAWTEKFKDLSMQPPAYFYGASSPDFFELYFYHRMFLRMTGTISRTMISRPSSSSGSGSHGGGFGGGFGGGGFGGGGGRGC